MKIDTVAQKKEHPLVSKIPMDLWQSEFNGILDEDNIPAANKDLEDIQREDLPRDDAQALILLMLRYPDVPASQLLFTVHDILQKIEKIFTISIKLNRLDAIEWLQESKPHELSRWIKENKKNVIGEAIAKGYLGIIKVFTKHAPNDLTEVMRTKNYHAIRAAALNGHLHVLQWFKTQVTPDELKAMLNNLNEMGFTPLHLAVLDNNYEGYAALVEAFPPHEINHFFKLSKQGKLPIDYLNKTKPDNRIRIDLERKLTHFSNKVKDLKDPIDLDEIMKSQGLSLSHELSKNLTYGFIAASAARRMIDRSSTHPSANRLPKKKYDDLVTSSDMSRKNYEKQNQELSATGDQYQLKKLENCVNEIKKQRMGKCFEYAQLVLYFLFQMGVKFQNVEQYMIENGDPAFIVLERDPKSNSRNYLTWGPSCVVIDAWAGEIYPANRMQKLGNFQCFTQQYGGRVNVVIPFDPDYHILKPSTSVKFSKGYFLEPKKLEPSLFKEEDLGLLAALTGSSDTTMTKTEELLEQFKREKEQIDKDKFPPEMHKKARTPHSFFSYEKPTSKQSMEHSLSLLESL